MPKNHYYDGAKITPREFALLNLLADGKPLRDIPRIMGVTDQNMRVILARLLPKIGQPDRTNVDDLRVILAACTGVAPVKWAKTKAVKDLTQMQTAVLAEIAKGKLFYEIGTILGITYSTVKAHANSAMKRAGLAGLYGEGLREAIKEKLRLGEKPPITMDDPFFN